MLITEITAIEYLVIDALATKHHKQRIGPFPKVHSRAASVTAANRAERYRRFELVV